MSSPVWADLGPRVRRDTLTSLDQALPPGRDVRRFFTEGGLRYRLADDGRVRVRGEGVEAAPFVYSLPLQRRDGGFRADASERLSRGTVGTDLKATAGVAANSPGADLASDINRWGEMAFELIVASNPIEVLRGWHRRERLLRFFRVGATPKFIGRQLLLRLIRHVMGGGSTETLPIGKGRPSDALTSGLMEVVPAAATCAPLIARHQPLAAIFLTRQGAQVAAVPAEGSGFLRPLALSPWPTGYSFLSLSGPGRGIYKTGLKELPQGHAADLLEASTRGVNRLFHFLTDPAQWTTEAGRFDHKRQALMWTSVIFGFEAITSMAADWVGAHSIWDAFRALGSLQGIWEGSQDGSVGLAPLLHPERVKRHAVAAFPLEVHREWAGAIVGNYASMLSRTFPNLTLDKAVESLVEVRHLLHGVHTQGGRPLMARHEVLEAIERAEADVQLVRDIAAIWWNGVLFDPVRSCRPGKPPWGRGDTASHEPPE